MYAYNAKVPDSMNLTPFRLVLSQYPPDPTTFDPHGANDWYHSGYIYTCIASTIATLPSDNATRRRRANENGAIALQR